MLEKLVVLGLVLVSACVQLDPETGETLPRGQQRYKFDHVEKRSEALKPGLSKAQVLLLLGSPYEKSARGDVWLYVPERPAILIPASALRLEFQGDVLKEYGRRPIVLGEAF